MRMVVWTGLAEMSILYEKNQRLGMAHQPQINCHVIAIDPKSKDYRDYPQDKQSGRILGRLRQR